MNISNSSAGGISAQLIDFLNNDVLLGALEENDIDDDVCFDCGLWNKGYSVLKCDSSKSSLIIPPISKTFVFILNEIEIFLDSQLCNVNCRDYGYKSQLERLLYIVIDLKNKVEAIPCVDTCNDSNIIAILLATLIQTILLLANILEYINGLIAYSENCGCTSIKLTEILMGKLINSITELQALLQDWYSIVITFFFYSSSSINPYIASYVPKQPIPIPRPTGPIHHACVPCPPPRPEPCPPPNYPHNNCTPFPY